MNYDQIRAAVHEVLTTPRYRQSAQRIQADYARHHAPTTAVALLEQMVMSKQPVLAIPGYDGQKAATALAVELN